MKITAITIVGLMTMTALLAGCTSPQGENEQTIPNPYPEESLETGELDGDEAEPKDKSRFEPTPWGAPYFTMELQPTTQGCNIRPSGLYAPGGVTEWFINTGEHTVGIQWTVEGITDEDGNLIGDQRQISTNGKWSSLALSNSSSSYWFCLVPLDDDGQVLTEGKHITIGLALANTQYLKG